MNARTLAVALAVALAACGAEPEPRDDDASVGAAPVPIDLAAFLPSAPRFSEEGAPLVACEPGGVVFEGGALEVRTGLCDPADVSVALPRRDAPSRLVGTLTHDALIADGGSGHVALTLGDDVLFELEVAIPQAAAYYAIDVALPETASGDDALSDQLGVHVHNHGANAWRFHGLAIVTAR